MIYIACSSKEIDRAEKWMQKCRENGIGVVCSWPANIRRVGVPNPTTASREERARWSMQNLNELVSAEQFWILMPEGPVSFGAAFELGFAVREAILYNEAQRKERAYPEDQVRPIYASGNTKLSVFTSLVTEFATDEEAFEQIVSQHVAATDRRARFAQGASAL